MVGKAMIIALLAFLLMAASAWAQGGAGGGGFGGTDMGLLIPGQPTNVVATAGAGEATVRFEPPRSEGGSPIIRYTVTSRPGRIEASGRQSPITVRGLTNGKTYSFTVTARNSIGTGLASEPSNCVTPKAE